jgi:hypothetical protein
VSEAVVLSGTTEVACPAHLAKRLDSRVRGNERTTDPFSPRKARPRSSGPDVRCEITPIRVGFLDQVELPNSVPFLELTLALECALPGFVAFKPDEHLDVVLSREARDCTDLMLPDSPREIVGHADIKCAVAAAGENVDVETHESVAEVLFEPQ